MKMQDLGDNINIFGKSNQTEDIFGSGTYVRNNVIPNIGK